MQLGEKWVNEKTAARLIWKTWIWHNKYF